MLRIGSAPPELEAEGERLLVRWLENNESLTWPDFLLKYASGEAIAYIREIEAAQAYAKENNVLI